jgi:hypothetical protein
MKRQRLLLLLALAALLTEPRAARAAPDGCENIAVECDADFRRRFPDLLEQVQSELSSRPNLDACARVELHLLPGSLIAVSVDLPDGRAASRKVGRSEDVLPTLQALLLLPGSAASAASLASDPAAAGAFPAITASPVSLQPSRDRPSSVWRPGTAEETVFSATTTSARQLGVELSLTCGARIGGGQLGYGVGALSVLEVKSWLAGFQGRIDRYRSLRGGDGATALQLAILGGRRLDFGAWALDLTTGPGLAIQSEATNVVESGRVEGGTDAPAFMAPPAPVSTQTPAPVPRLAVAARLGLNRRSLFGAFVGVDAELGPTAARGAGAADGAATGLPQFSIGLALGATVGSL